MRPGVEDFVQFLIQECGFDSVSGWRREIERSRARWRLVQTKTLVREAPVAAAKGLAEHLGVKVLRLARLSKGNDAVGGSFGRW
jgi:hypothetical protein